MKVIKVTSTHYLFDDGTKYPRVTSVLDTAPKPFLVRWMVNSEREYVIEVAADLHEAAHGGLSRPGYIAALAARLTEEKANRKKAREAANIGTEAHALIEWTLRRELIPKEDKKSLKKLGKEPAVSQPALIAFQSWQEWRASLRLEPIYIEQTVYSRDLEVAGTFDLLAQFKLGLGFGQNTGILDWKTSGDIYPEQRMQVAIYRHCFIEMGHADASLKGVLVKLSKKGAPEFGVTYVEPDECDELVEEFRHLRGVWDFFTNRRGERKPKPPVSYREAVRAEELEQDDPFAGLVGK